MLKRGGWDNGSREERCWLHGYSRGDRSEGMCGWECPRGSVVCLESAVPLLRGAWGAGTQLPYASSCLHMHWEGPPPERAHHSLLQLPVGPHCCRQLAHTPIVAAVPLPGLSKCASISRCFHSFWPGWETDS